MLGIQATETINNVEGGIPAFVEGIYQKTFGFIKTLIDTPKIITEDPVAFLTVVLVMVATGFIVIRSSSFLFKSNHDSLAERSESEIQKSNNSFLISKTPLTIPEQKFYFILVKAVPELIILPQVSFSRFLEAKGGNKSESFALFATARQKVADYLVCDHSFNIICAIELDDSTHSLSNDKKRDEILKNSGINTVRFKTNKIPSSTTLKEAIYKNIQRSTKSKLLLDSLIEGRISGQARVRRKIFIRPDDELPDIKKKSG
jgi:hypothetical protein